MVWMALILAFISIVKATGFSIWSKMVQKAIILYNIEQRTKTPSLFWSRRRRFQSHRLENKNTKFIVISSRGVVGTNVQSRWRVDVRRGVKIFPMSSRMVVCRVESSQMCRLCIHCRVEMEHGDFQAAGQEMEKGKREYAMSIHRNGIDQHK